MKHEDIISKLTLEEKAGLCSGRDYWNTKAIPSVGVESMMLTDGPHGIRKRTENKTKEEKASLKGVPAICFPTAATTACSWDTDLLREMGEVLGEECLKEKVSVLLGPGSNIKRSPLCGRNFEYFSEDPYLAGEMAASFVNGVQSKGIGTSMKHYAANSQETRRMTVNSVIDERTMREIYLPAFENAVKKAQPWTIMCAYNRLNGTYCAEHKWLLTDVLRNEWGYKGIIVTDWGAENERVPGLLAGQELEMPTSNGVGDKQIVEAVKQGLVEESFLDEAVDKLIDMALRAQKVKGDNYTYDPDEHHALAKKIAEQSMVLLKNDGILPLNREESFAVIGEMAKAPRYQGAGSSLINPIKIDNAFNTMVDSGFKVEFAAGYDKTTDTTDESLINGAVEAAKSADVALLFVGLTEAYESEGFDRKHTRIPQSHIDLIKAVKAVNDKVVVVLSGGSSVEMPWIDSVNAVLHTYLSGQASGSAAVDVLFGNVNPSGKLAETYPLNLSDNSSYNYFSGTQVSVEYRESVYVGYRYYDTAKKDVLFPFGYGLSYTTFEYSDIELSSNDIKDTDELLVKFKVKNTGKVDGAEVCELYVNDMESTIFRPEKELKGFKKVFLKVGEEKEVEIKLDKRAFAYYNVYIHDWHVETGKFKILIGASSRDIRLKASVYVTSSVECEIPDYRENAPCYYGADITNVPDEQFAAVYGRALPPNVRDKTKKLGLCNTLEDAADGKWGKRINKMLIKMLGDDGMASAIALQTPIRDFISMSMGVFSPKMAEGLLLILNDESFPRGLGKIVGDIGHALKGIGPLMKSI